MCHPVQWGEGLLCGGRGRTAHRRRLGGQKAGDKGESGAQVCRETQTITDQSESQSETTGLAAVFPDGGITAAPPEGHNAAAKQRYNTICGRGGTGGGATV